MYLTPVKRKKRFNGAGGAGKAQGWEVGKQKSEIGIKKGRDDYPAFRSQIGADYHGTFIY